MHDAVAVDQHRGAVEHQLVLAADDVEVGDAPRRGRRHVSCTRCASSASRCACLSRSNGEAFGTSTSCAPFAAVDATGSANHRSSQITRPTLHAIDLEHAILAIRIDVEIAAFVEHRVVGQLALAIGGRDAAVAQHAGGVVHHRARRLRPADDGDDALRAGGDALQRGFAVGEERRPQQQVFRRIAAECEFREQHQVGAVLVARLARSSRRCGRRSTRPHRPGNRTAPARSATGCPFTTPESERPREAAFRVPARCNLTWRGAWRSPRPGRPATSPW